MENFIIIAILCIVLVFAVRSTVKHFKGEGGCCGGSTYKPKRKRLSRIIGKKQFIVEGMHCENCKNRIERIVNDIDDISGKVDLKKKCLTVSYAVNTDDSVIIAKIEKAGYKIARIN